MNISSTPLEGALLIEPKIFGDPRGRFYESYQEKRYNDAGINARFIQDNLSYSQGKVLRGLHYQLPHTQAKLISVIEGEVFDVVVDLRKNSPTFAKHFSVILSSQNHLQLFIPQGFAHGFCTLSEYTIFFYKCSDYYQPESECGILWNDPDLKINWPMENPTLSEKDKVYPLLKNISDDLLF